MGALDLLRNAGQTFVAAFKPSAPPVATPLRTDERGTRSTPENSLKAIYRSLWVDPELRQAILDIRAMDKIDPRVKRIHSRVAGDTVRGGLVFTQESPSPIIKGHWETFSRSLCLDRPGKLKSDARALVMQGNLAIQWVLDDRLNVVGGVTMPAETIVPQTGLNGRFVDPLKAYLQINPTMSTTVAEFALWKLSLARLDPDSFDDQGSLGRPYLDAARGAWKKLIMTEEDLVIRRRTRAPQKLSHILEGATREELIAYQAGVEANNKDITTDYYSNKKGGVNVLQGDAQMGEINDVTHLLDTFFTASPFAKFLLGYTGDVARDVVEDLLKAYYDDLDFLQDETAWVYNEGFALHLLLKGINPVDADYCIKFAERRTESLSQTTDRMLKWMALDIPKDLIYEEMGLDAADVKERRDNAINEEDPYPDGAGGDQPAPNVTITPGNGKGGGKQSATDITNK